MDTKVLNYRIIIEPEIDRKSGKKIYNSFCPKLGVADWGATVEQSLGRIKEGIECQLEAMAECKSTIPESDSQEFMVATTNVNLPTGFGLSFG
ncbi:type II toxin-antitoxin system HicB family antitoxin [Patescibacteria group bacterium]|nr:type II toxin-antitoxin system HicB family antitoxin [Patescibacteria group bacterium]